MYNKCPAKKEKLLNERRKRFLERIVALGLSGIGHHLSVLRHDAIGLDTIVQTVFSGVREYPLLQKKASLKQGAFGI